MMIFNLIFNYILTNIKTDFVNKTDVAKVREKESLFHSSFNYVSLSKNISKINLTSLSFKL
jgi:hypothetical protein